LFLAVQKVHEQRHYQPPQSVEAMQFVGGELWGAAG
jgi:hypothetical protein